MKQIMADASSDQQLYELCRSTLEDLVHIADSWRYDMGEADLRRASAQLRRLLVDGDYRKAWRAVGLTKEPIVHATDLQSYLGALERRYIAYAYAPLAQRSAFGSLSSLSGSQQQEHFRPPRAEVGDLLCIASGYLEGLGVAMIRVPSSDITNSTDRESLAQDLISHMGLERRWAPYWLSGFLRSEAAIIDGLEISRRHIIKYVANRLGGVHSGSQNSVRDASVYERLDSYHVTSTGINSIYLELCSIGHCLAWSSDAYRFEEAFRDVNPPDESRRLPDTVTLRKPRVQY